MEPKNIICFLFHCFVLHSAYGFLDVARALFSVQVRIAQGTIQGRRESIKGTANLFNLFMGEPYFSFLGIPYAQPPVGVLRFKSPLTPQPWTGVREAFSPGSKCLQSDDLETESEDCLYINVYTPELAKQDVVLKSVMVWIHGGGFKLGNGYNIYGPDYLLAKDVVLVTFNYRVAALGFLSLEDDLLSGNFGLKDQVQALRWVQQNIASFGGDPNKVTIFGESAGGSSVHYHLLSPLSKGLFHKAIIQSGSALNSWAFNPTPKATAIRLAQNMGINSTNLNELYNLFMKASASSLTKASDELIKEELDDVTKMNVGIFVPSKEMNGIGEKFITLSPREILRGGNFTKVPLIMGSTNAEGILLLAMKKLSNNDFKIYNNVSDWAVPTNWKIEPGLEKDQLGKTVKQYFFNGDQVSWSTINSLVDFFTDVYFLMDNQESLTAHLRHSSTPIYNYEFTYNTLISGRLIASLYQFQILNLKGASHGDELRLLFPSHSLQVPLTIKEKEISDILTTMWTNFAKTSNPNYSGLEVKWKPLTKDSFNYLEIGNALKVYASKVQQKRLQFWQDVCKTTSTNLTCSDL